MRIKFIVNPRSKQTNQSRLVKTVHRILAGFEIDIESTARSGHATSIARKAVRDNYDTIVAVGGDGTVNEVLNGIVGTKTALGIIPTGTANDLASFCHIPEDLTKACELIKRHPLQAIDVIRVNGWCYLTAGGIGLPSRVAGIANSIKSNGKTGQLIGRVTGSKLYLLAVVGALLSTERRRNPLQVNFGKGQKASGALSLTVNNQPFLGRNFLVSPRAVNNDGMLDVCLIENSTSLMQSLAIIYKVLTGRHIFSPQVRTWQVREMRLETEQPISFLGDGEMGPKAKDFKIEILPRSLHLITAGALGN